MIGDDDVVVEIGFGYCAVRMLMQTMVMIMQQKRLDGADRNYNMKSDDDDDDDDAAVMAASWCIIFSSDWTILLSLWVPMRWLLSNTATFRVVVSLAWIQNKICDAWREKRESADTTSSH